MVRRLDGAALALCVPAWWVLACGCATAADDGFFPDQSIDEVQEGDGGSGGTGGAPGVINVTVTSVTTSSSTVTSSTVTTTTGGGDVCDTGSCETCQQCAMNGVCNSTANACLDNPECGALWECLSTCVDDTCANACASAHPGGMDQFNAVGECVFCTGCPTTCGC